VAFQVSKVLSTVQGQDATRLPSFMMQHSAIDASLQRAVVGVQRAPGTFIGSPQRISYVSSLTPRGAEHVDTAVRLELRSADGTTRLVAVEPAGETVLMNAVGSLSFDYADDNMRSHSQWPPLVADTGSAKVPRSVRLRERDRGLLLQWVLNGPRLAHPALPIGAGAFGTSEPPP
jgi:hypothetical protein